VRDDKDETGPYILGWNESEMGPWPTVADGFSRLQLRDAPIALGTTASVDIPLKIPALDQILVVLQKDLPAWINKGNQLSTGGWWNSIAGGKEAELNEQITAWNQNFRRIFDDLEKIGKDNKFPDIVELCNPPLREHWDKVVSKFVQTVNVSTTGGKLSPEALKVFVEPVGQVTYAELNKVEEWRARAEKQTISIRQQLSR
jgi:hypothetical protein